MHKRMLLFAALCTITLSLLTMWGCNGGGGESQSTGLEDNGSLDESGYSAYVFGPAAATSGQALYKLYNLTDTTTEEGLVVLDSPDQAPSDYVALIGCRVTLPDGTEVTTDSSGRFRFNRIPYNSSEKGIPLLLDPSQSNHPRFARVIVPLIVPRRGAELPLDKEGLRLVVKPASLLLSQDARFLYHAFWVDDEKGALYVVPADEVTWSVETEGGGETVGTMSSLIPGLFRAYGLGKGSVVATVTTSSGEMTASGEVEVVSRQQVARIYGQVTDIGHQPIAGVTIFVSGFENGVTTNGQGNYLIPRVPTEKSMTLTFIYRGIVVKTLNDVFVGEGEAKEINLQLDTFRETGRVSYRPGQNQSSGQIVLAVEGVPGPLSTDEFPGTKEFELLGVAEVDHDLYLQLQEDPNLSVPVMVEGEPLFSSADMGNFLPQVQVDAIQILNIQQDSPVQTLIGDIAWVEGQVSFRVEARNQNATPAPFILKGMEKFARILEKLQGDSGVWFSVKIIGQVDRAHSNITVIEISLVETFFEGNGRIYYDPQFGPDGAILMETSSSLAAGRLNSQRGPYLLLNVQSASPEIYDLLMASSDQGFSGTVSGVEIDDPNWAAYDCQPVKVSRIQLYSDEGNYLLHKQGKIWLDVQGRIRFSLSLTVQGNGNGYFLLEEIDPFNDLLTDVRQSPGIAFSCFLSGKIQKNDDGTSSIIVWQLEINGRASDGEGGANLKAEGFIYYDNNTTRPTGGIFVYQKFLPDGSIDNKELYELSNLTRGKYSDTADLLKDTPGLIIQIDDLNATNTNDLNGGQQNPLGGLPRLLVNSMTVLEDVDPLLKISGSLIYHSWENILEMVATSPAFRGENYQSYILQSVPEAVMSQILDHPDRFIPVSGIIQVLRTERRSSLEPQMARALDLTIKATLD
ncbi:MAG: carboxypeptidase-like regulatory domain-containing protein [bacterium]